MRSRGNQLRAISQVIPQPWIINISLKITYLKLHSNPPGANVFKQIITGVALFHLTQWWAWWAAFLGAVSIRKTVFPGMGIPMLKIRRPVGRLIFNMGITIPSKTVFLIETAPCFNSPPAANCTGYPHHSWSVDPVVPSTCNLAAPRLGDIVPFGY